MTALEALAWSGAAALALMALTAASLLGAALCGYRHDRRHQPEPPAWVNHGRLDARDVDLWIHQIDAADAGTIQQEAAHDHHP